MTSAKKIENTKQSANFRLVSSIEKAKSYLETIIDESPDSQFIFDRTGQVLKMNQAAGAMVNIDFEKSTLYDMESLLNSQSWKLVKSKVDMLNPERKNLGFEMEVSHENLKDQYRVMHWNLSSVSNDTLRSEFFVLTGRDVSETIKYKKMVGDIFQSVPIGILTLNRHCRVEDFCSKHSEFLLNMTSDEARGADYYDVLFRPSEKYLSTHEVEMSQQIHHAFGEDIFWFDSLKTHFPRFIERKNGKQTLYLKLNYHPILTDGLVNQIMIILEDYTTIFNEKEYYKTLKLKNSTLVRRIQQIENCDPEIVSNSIIDLDRLLERLDESWNKKDKIEFLNSLHGIKSASRIASFKDLADATHNLEKLVSSQETKKIEITARVKEMYIFIKSECLAFKKIERALNAMGNEIHSKKGRVNESEVFEKLKKLKKTFKSGLTKSQEKTIDELINTFDIQLAQLSSLNQYLQIFSKETSETLGKEIKISFDWNNIYVPVEVTYTIKEVTTHFINNAIDHSIETSTVRKRLNKANYGNIMISARIAKDGDLAMSIADDGKGIDTKKIAKIAVDKKLVTKKEVESMSDKKIWDFIFSDNFSTKSKVSHISGRGIGMSAIKHAIESQSGKPIKIESEFGEGCKFTFKLKLKKR